MRLVLSFTLSCLVAGIAGGQATNATPAPISNGLWLVDAAYHSDHGAIGGGPVDNVDKWRACVADHGQDAGLLLLIAPYNVQIDSKKVDGKPNTLSYSFSTDTYSADFVLTILSPSRAEATGTKNYRAASDDPIKSSRHHFEMKYQSPGCDGLAAGGLQIWMVDRWVPMARL